MKTFLAPARLVFAGALAAALLTGPACTQVQVAPDTRGQYKLGELQVFVDRDFAAVHSAAVRGLKDTNLFQTQDDRKVVEAELRARDVTDSMVIVKIKEVGPNRTSIKIRYGVFTPDLPAAQKLYDSIRKYL